MNDFIINRKCMLLILKYIDAQFLVDQVMTEVEFNLFYDKIILY